MISGLTTAAEMTRQQSSQLRPARKSTENEVVLLLNADIIEQSRAIVFIVRLWFFVYFMALERIPLLIYRI